MSTFVNSRKKNKMSQYIPLRFKIDDPVKLLIYKQHLNVLEKEHEEKKRLDKVRRIKCRIKQSSRSSDVFTISFDGKHLKIYEGSRIYITKERNGE